MSSHHRKWGMAGAILAVLGGILLLASLAVGWYTFTASVGGTSVTTNLLPGSSYQSPNGTHTYSSINEPSESTLYMTLLYLIVVGGVLGLLGGIMGLVSGRLSGGMKWLPAIFVIIGLLMAIGSVAYLAVGQPSAYKSDYTQNGVAAPSGSWPGGSFIGSSSTGAGGISFSYNWGPGVGWYLAIVAIVLFLIAMVLGWRAMKMMAETHDMPAAPASPAPDASGGAPPTM